MSLVIYKPHYDHREFRGLRTTSEFVANNDIYLNVGNDRVGDIYYRGVDGKLVRLPPSDDGTVLSMAGGVPVWSTGSGGGGGTNGREIELRNSGSSIQWRYVGDPTWTDLVSVATLTGPQGIQGFQGPIGPAGPQGITGAIGPQGPIGITGAAGANGKQIELQAGTVYIQWRYVGDLVWNNLVSIASITGPQGPQGPSGTNGTNGIDGKQVTLQNNGTFIQWKYVGDPSFTNLVALSAITGPQGAQGLTGPTGATGATGPAGTNGQGVPTGGTANQVLAKIDGTNYNTQWVSALSALGVKKNGSLVNSVSGLNFIEGTNITMTISNSASAGYIDIIINSAGGGGGTPNTVRNGTGAPGAGVGIDGDFYIDNGSHSIYGPKTAGAWGTATSLIGPQGTSGTNGIDGKQVQMDNNGTFIRWKYTVDTTWTNLVSLASITGPQGATGATGATGAAGAQGPQGIQGPQGLTGATGAQGPAGQGVPVGGLTNQVLTKNSNGDFDTKWAAIPAPTFPIQKNSTTVGTVGGINFIEGSNVTMSIVTSGNIMNVTINSTIPSGGTVTSVNASASGALNFSGGPITSSGTLALGWTGTASQYVKGNGAVGTFPTNVSAFTNDAGYLSAVTFPIKKNNTLVNTVGGINFKEGTNVTMVVSTTGDGYMDVTINAAIASSGTVTSVGIIGSGALSFGGSPITTNGNITAAWGGTTAQYVRGDGTLATFPVLQIASPTVLGGVKIGTGISIDGTGIISVNVLTPRFSIDGTGGNLNLVNDLASPSAYNVYSTNGTGVKGWQLLSSIIATLGYTPAGANTQIQYNNGGQFGASALFTFDSGGRTFQVGALTNNSNVNSFITGDIYMQNPTSAGVTLKHLLNQSGIWSKISGSAVIASSGNTIFATSNDFSRDGQVNRTFKVTYSLVGALPVRSGILVVSYSGNSVNYVELGKVISGTDTGSHASNMIIFPSWNNSLARVEFIVFNADAATGFNLYYTIEAIGMAGA